ncbi:MAG: DEAD/DEAH box helicase [Phycisphaerales bacterium]
MSASAFNLKTYQHECLEALGEFLKEARAAAGKGGAESVFNRFGHERKPRGVYQAVKGWRESAEFPYVCVRVPTGGGKTLMAAHAVGLTIRRYLNADRAVVLWMAPSEKIIDQTVAQLRDRSHPVRKALAEAVGGQVEVLSLEEALYVSRAVLDSSTAVIVSTIQAWRVEAKDGRKVYQPDNGALMHHFDGVPAEVLRRLEKGPAGEPVYSLANVLRARRPIVIADEAHHFRTKLSFDTLKRFNPAAIIEFTATPYGEGKEKVPANVLVEATAADLKAEDMIKAPVVLKETEQWRDAVRLAVAKRKELERVAKAEHEAGAEYIRPLVLLQAESQYEDRKTVTVDVLREYLIQEEKVPADEVVVHANDERELPNDVLSASCKVSYVVTVKALSEGWDCPFAYVLCTVSTVSASTAVEQILGRILRMPYAKRRGAALLNQAYCYTSSGDFGQASRNLQDALVQAGFGRDEAEGMVVPDSSTRSVRGERGPGLWSESVALRVESVPDAAALKALPKPLRESLSVTPSADGVGSMVMWSGGALTKEDAAKIGEVLNVNADPTAGERLRRLTWGEDASPAAMGVRMDVPGLSIPDPHAEGGYTLFEAQHTETPWALADCKAEFDAGEFEPLPALVSTTNLDVDEEGRWRDRYEGELRESVLWQDAGGPKTLDELAAWLDREVFDVRVTQPDKSEFIDRALAYITERRGLKVESLVPARWRLASAMSRRIDGFRLDRERRQYQETITGLAVVPSSPTPAAAFSFSRALGVYPALRPYLGSKKYEKHYFPVPGEMNDEEAVCAQLIDAHPNVQTWVRNLERIEHSFWLPKAHGKFYPDYVALLRDGRYAVIEHKGQDRAENPEELEKKALGDLYEARSGGRCLFVWSLLSSMKSVITERLKAVGQ